MKVVQGLKVFNFLVLCMVTCKYVLLCTVCNILFYDYHMHEVCMCVYILKAGMPNHILKVLIFHVYYIKASELQYWNIQYTTNKGYIVNNDIRNFI